MVQQLQQIQRGLSGEIRTDNMLRQKIIASCEDHPACNVAYFRPSLALPGLINNIHASISSYEKTKRAESNSSTFFTDRQYHGPSSNNDRQRPNNTSHPQQFAQGNEKSDEKMKKCFVCRKEGCWSTKHTEEERR